VVHGKSPMIYKMPGDDWQKFANLRLLYGYMFTHPGTKLLFMGDEIGQTQEWNFRSELNWHLLEHPTHRGLQRFVKDVNHLYTSQPGLYRQQFSYDSFEWVNVSDYDNSVLAYLRKSEDPKDTLLIILNLTPATHEDYMLALSEEGTWQEILNSDDPRYYGSGVVNTSPLKTVQQPYNGKDYTLRLRVPPLGAAVFKGVK